MTQISNHRQVGYCTNIHAGSDLDSVIANLEQFAVPVRKQLDPKGELGIGLWLSNDAASCADHRIEELKRFLDSNQLIPFTFNAFPFSNFHQPVVKHGVYLPTWASAERLRYTQRIVQIADQLLPKGQLATISTLPLGWPIGESIALKRASANNLKNLARHLEQLEMTSGRQVIICIEPEPGCALQTSADVVAFFEEYLVFETSTAERESILRYLGVCHDICHAAVMFEEQQNVLESYQRHGINIGKVQVSSAIGGTINQRNSREIIEQLSSFAEPRYLHQTNVQRAGDQQLYEDLPLALESFGNHSDCDFRSHFHVPIFLDELGLLETTRCEILKCLEVLRSNCESRLFSGHFEIETYAWTVSPENIRSMSLVDSIVNELTWFFDQLDA